jgi:hypothetical protein
LDEIHFLIRQGGGGFTYHDCYHLPIQIRKYNLKKLSADIKKENDRIAAQSEKNKGNASMEQLASGEALGMNKKPNYTTKSPRK